MFWKQLYLLLWKNYIIRKRHPIRTLIEIIWPLILLLALIAIRKSQVVERQGECHYPARAMPSAGVYPWFKSLLCDVENPCFNVSVSSETPGQINDPASIANGSMATNSLASIINLVSINTTIVNNLGQLTSDLSLLNNATQAAISNMSLKLSSLLDNQAAYTTYLTGTLLLSANVTDTIVNSNVTFFQAILLPTTLGARAVVCASATLSTNLQFPASGPSSASEVSTALCNLTDSQLALFSNQTAENLGNATIISQKFQMQGINAVDPSPLNTSNVFAAQQRLNNAILELQGIQGPLTDALNVLNQGITGTSLVSMLLGVNASSPDVVEEICGHPQKTNTILSGFVTTVSGNSSIATAFSSLFNPATAGMIPDARFCQNFERLMQSNPTISVIWSTAKVFLYGKITYSPDSPLVQQIIKEANATFNTVAFVRQAGEYWRSTNGPALYQTLESGNTTTNLRQLLNNQFAVNLITSQTNITEAQVEQLKVFLSNDDNSNDNVTTWKDTFRQIDGLILVATKLLKCFELDKFVGFATEDDLVLNSLALLDNSSLFGGIVFESISSNDVSLPEVVKYKIRQDTQSVTRTNRIQRRLVGATAESRTDQVKYYISGFVHLQDLVESAILKYRNHNNDSRPLGSYLQFMPYPCYTRDRFLEFLSGLLSLIMTLAWIYSVCIIIKNIVYEKEQRLKEVMKMMGLSNGVHWVAWFINSFSLMVISVFFMMIVLKAGDITPFSNMFLIFLWLSLFVISIIGQCFLISCFFSRANLAAACGGIIFFLLYIPYNMTVAWEDRITYGGKLGACLLSNVAFGYGAAYISDWELAGDGIQFSNWGRSTEPGDQLNFATTLVMLLVDSIIYFMLTWYIENVFPGKYGVPKPWYFFATRSYWCGPSKRSKKNNEQPANNDVEALNANLEAEPTDNRLGVAIHNIKKVYGNGKVAVDDLSINFFEDQITSFLGHNGAGKTTTMSMLTGLFTPTSGTAYVYGNDICTEMDSIRSQLGFCPQHNVLFGDLTVYEHLKLYSGLKNSQGGEEEISKMLKDVGLPHKKDEISRHLSGGMKRKLSVAVAFVGGSKCVILDEPTAGVDPYARRGIWDLLLAYRKNRTIILSTHHMDEADLLGDRIAIISHGKLKCCGSSIFLKGNYGVGYYLTLVKNGRDVNSVSNVQTTFDDPKKSQLSIKTADEGFGSLKTGGSSKTSSLASSSSASIQQLTVETDSSGASTSAEKFPTPPKGEKDYSKLVLDIIPSAKLHEQDAREMTFILPYVAQRDGWYAKLFGLLDQRGISYGLTDTSLEEIFLTVAEESRDEGRDENSKCCLCIPRRRRKKRCVTPESELDSQARRTSSRRKKRERSASQASQNSGQSLEIPEAEPFDDGSQGRGSYKVTGKKLVFRQFQALFIKRFHHARRNRKGFVAQVIVPAVFVALALAFALIIPGNRNLPPLEMQPWMYGDTNTFFSNDDVNSSSSSAAADALISQPGIGMRCVTNYSVLNFDDKYIQCDNIQGQTWQPDSSIRGYSQPVTSNETITCKCTDKESTALLAECLVGAGGQPTDRVISETSNPMYNMTGRKVADWMVKTTERFKKDRYGGLSFGEKYYTTWTSQQFTVVKNLLLGNLSSNFSEVDLENFVRTENTQVWFDNNGFHSMPTWLNVLNNAALRSILPSEDDQRKFGIAAINHPLNYSKSQVDEAATRGSAADLITSICVIFALSFIPASFVLFLIEEKVTKAKHLQFVSGVNQFVYWIATFLWDLVNYTVPAIIVILIFLCFQTKAYVSENNFGCLVCLLLLYGFAITPMMYPASFFFTVPSTAYVVLTCINLFIGINASIATFVLELLDDPALSDANFYLQRIFLIFPQYCMGRGLIDMAINQAYTDAAAAFGVDRSRSPFEFDLVGRNLMAMAIVGTVSFILTVLIQYRFFIKTGTMRGIKNIPLSAEPDDEDVKMERERIIKNLCDDILQVKSLTKIYKNQGSGKPLVAVDSMYVGVPEGECFGLLGVNGAGKTTTFKMLTGDTPPSSGDASISDQSILSNMRDVQQNTGYCPQFEALNSLLTGREHLEFYAKLRGVPPEDISRVASWGIDKFGLKMYAEKCAGTYSGGNKRKLSAAIAFIGCPPVVFLDEPTAGMDPMSRRFLWTRIAEAVRGGRCIVLTSHSMEECEALCSRLAIMVNGRFQCIGSPQHLKNRFGEGYTLTVKVDARCEEPENVQKFISSSFPTSLLKEHHSNMLLYQIPLADVKLSHLFDVMESNKQQFHIEDYSVSQTTLDEVFVNFAKMQTDGVEDGESPEPSINHGYQGGRNSPDDVELVKFNPNPQTV